MPYKKTDIIHKKWDNVGKAVKQELAVKEEVRKERKQVPMKVTPIKGDSFTHSTGYVHGMNNVYCTSTSIDHFGNYGAKKWQSQPYY